MKTKSFPLLPDSGITLAFALSLVIADASQIAWNGSSSTSWALPANWIGNAVPADDLTTDIALFNLASYTNQPNAGTTSIAGIQIGDGTTTTGSLTLSGTMLTIGGSGIDMKANAGAINVSSAVTLGAPQTWQNASANLLTVSGPVTGGSNLLTVGGAGNTSISGAVGGTGGLAKSGAGTLTLSSVSNTLSGGVSISGGTLSIAAAANLPSGNAVMLSGGGVLAVSGNPVTLANSVTVASGQSGVIRATGSGYAILAGNYSGVAGALELDIGNGGRIDINSANGPAIGATVTVSDQATTGTHYMAMNNNNAPTFYANAKVTFNDTGVGVTNVFLGNTGNRNYSFGALDGGAQSTVITSDNATSTVTVTGKADGNFAGIISNSGTISFVKNGSSTQTLSGNNSYTGGTTVNDGTLSVGHVNALGSGTVTVTGGTLALGGFNIAQTTIALNGGALTNTTAYTGTVNVGGAAAITGTYGTINAGTVASRAINTTGGLAVSTLTGQGTFSGGTVNVTTQLAIGNSAGTANFANLGLAGSSVFEVGTGSGDLANVSGTLTLGGTLDLNLLAGSSYVANEVYTLFSYSGTNLSGNFNGLADGAVFTDAGGAWMIDYDSLAAGTNGGSGNRFVTVTAVPEPAAALLGCLGVLALMRRRRNS